MIHPPAIRVTCDAEWCESSLTFPGSFTRKTIVEFLVEEHGWLLRAGQHYCCQVCADARVEPPFNPIHE